MNRLNKNILILISVFVIASCSYNYKTNVNEVIELRSEKEGEDVQVQGYVIIEDLTLIRLYPSKTSKEYLDLNINKTSHLNVKLKHEKYVCVNIVGNFHEFLSDSILIGNISSKYGVITVKSLDKCQK